MGWVTISLNLTFRALIKKIILESIDLLRICPKVKGISDFLLFLKFNVLLKSN